MSETIFRLEQVDFGYRGQPALQQLSLTIDAGCRVALLGANGSGKSTLLRLLAALAFPAAGNLQAFGRELNEAAFADDALHYDFRRRVGLVFQNPEVQLFNPTVVDELAFAPLQLGWSRERTRDAIERMLTRFGLAHLRDRAPHRLSGGEKKRVALASVLMVEPEVLLLDEPTAALDPQSQSDVLRLLVESRDSGRTVVTATHDLAIVGDIADRVLVLDAGHIVADGTPGDILADDALLARCHLTHAHWHVHGDGVAHAHAHLHAGAHRHPH